MRNHSAHAYAFIAVLALSLAAACTKNSPSAPAPAAKPNVSITAVSVTAEALSSGGYSYRVTVKMRESGGVAATLSGLDLTFMRDSTTLLSSHVDRPISDASNVVAANATADSREIATTDGDLTHPAANKVIAKVTFADGASSTSSATASADIATPAATLFTLSGTISDEGSARMIAGGTVQILDGPDAGKTSGTDAGGAYSISGLTGGSFMVRASASGYAAREQSVTMSRDATVDLRLRPMVSTPAPPPSPTPSPSPAPPSTPCAYAISPTQAFADYEGSTLTATISRTSGTCSWQANSDASWLTFSGAASGNSSATLTYVIAPNGFNGRTATITISWTGGSAQLRVTQGVRPDWECLVFTGKGPQDFDNVPSAGGQLTISVSITSVPVQGHPSCGGSASAFGDVSWIGNGGSTTITFPFPFGTTFTVPVAANPSPGTPRSGSIVVTAAGKRVTVPVRQR